LADRKKAFAYAMPNGKEFKFAMPAIPPVPPVPGVPAMPAFADMDVPVSVVVVHSAARSGLMVENLTPQLGEFFGAKSGHGVLVRSVEKGSRADKAGFRAGDVIVKVNGEAITDSSDFTHALHSRKQNNVSVNIIRDRKEQTITLPLPERKQSSVFESVEDLPDIHAETDIDLSDLRSELAQIGPQVQLAVEQAQRTMEEVGETICKQTQEWKQKHRKEIEKQKLELRKQQQSMREQTREQIRDQMHTEQDQLRNEVRKELQGLSTISR